MDEQKDRALVKQLVTVTSTMTMTFQNLNMFSPLVGKGNVEIFYHQIEIILEDLNLKLHAHYLKARPISMILLKRLLQN